MANQRYLKMPAKGVEAWNKWRSKHRDLTPYLRGAVLKARTSRERTWRVWI
jgi:hypothetical protein